MVKLHTNFGVIALDLDAAIARHRGYLLLQPIEPFVVLDQRHQCARLLA